MNWKQYYLRIGGLTWFVFLCLLPIAALVSVFSDTKIFQYILGGLAYTVITMLILAIAFCGIMAMKHGNEPISKES